MEKNKESVVVWESEDRMFQVLYSTRASFQNRYTQKDIQRVKKFFNRDNVYKQLKTMVSFLIPHRSDVKLILNVGGGSFTDGKSITVGLPDIFIGRSYGEIFTALRALVGHESQHVNSSDFPAFIKYIEDVTNYFANKYPALNSNVGRKYLQKIAHGFGNSVEDGRIERITPQKFKGYARYYKFFNMSLWEAQPIQGNSELEDFMYCIISFSVTGLNPKGFKKFYDNTELEENLNKIKPMILQGIEARTCQDCLNQTFDIIKAVEPYLVKLLTDRTQETEDYLNNMDDSNEFTTSEESEHNNDPSSVSTHFKPKKSKKQEEKKDEEQQEQENKESGEEEDSKQKSKKKKKDQKDAGDDDKQEEKSSGGSDSDSEEEDEKESGDENASGNGSSKEEEESEENENGKGGSSDEESSDENETDESDENSNGKGIEDSDEEDNDSESDGEGDGEDGEDEDDSEEGKDKNSSDQDSDDESNEGEEGNESKDSSDDDSSDQNSDSDSDSDSPAQDTSDDDEKQSDHNPSGVDEEEEIDEEEVASFIEQLTKEVEEEANEKIQQKKDDIKKQKLKEEDFKLNEEELRELENRYKNDSHKRFVEVEDLKLRHQLPADIKREGNRFRKEVERIFRNKEEYTLRGQKRGILDVGNIHRVQTKEYNVFLKKGVPIKSDYVGYLLEDGSGSMSEQGKWNQSKRALAVMEEGLKGIIPFKIATFNTDFNGNSVVHQVVKDFKDENKTYNYSYNAFAQRRPAGMNKDGYSIRVATKELLKRPEKDRILIIFSDGLPSSYRGGKDAGMVDVKEAVKEARKAGIFVVALLFGTEEFRDMNIESYRYMYEKNIISCEPSMISNQLTRMLKKVISH